MVFRSMLGVIGVKKGVRGGIAFEKKKCNDSFEDYSGAHVQNKHSVAYGI